MVILAELGHVINVNKAREGIKFNQNNAHMLIFQWSFQSFIGIRIRRVCCFFYIVAINVNTVYCHCDSFLGVHFGLIPDFLIRRKVSILPLGVDTDKAFSVK